MNVFDFQQGSGSGVSFLKLLVVSPPISYPFSPKSRHKNSFLANQEKKNFQLLVLLIHLLHLDIFNKTH